MGGFLGSGGDLRTALIGGLGAALASGIGSHFGNPTLTKEPLQFLAKALAHGAVQGGVSEALGGRFRDGLLGGFAGSAFEPLAAAIESGTDSAIVATLATAVIGGTVSVIGGGKFANGAASAAFVDLFNRQLHQPPRDERAERLAAIERVREAVAKGETVPLVDLLGGTDLDQDALAQIAEARGDVIFRSDSVTESLSTGTFENIGKPLSVDRVAIEKKLSGSFSVSKDKLVLDKIQGLSGKLGPFSKRITSITVTPDEVDIGL